MKRRKFLKITSLTFLTTGLSSFAQPFLVSSEKRKSINNEVKIIKPRGLREKSKVGVIAPASSISEEDFEKIKSNLESLGLIAIPSKNLFKKFGYLAGSDEDRVFDFHEMFSRNDIDGIICARGGYGTPRLLRLINFELVRKNPKVLIGYSDITALLVAIYSKTGLVTFHGAVGISTFNDFTKKYFYEVLMSGKEYIEFESVPEESDLEDSSIQGILKIASGRSEGRLIGGNLSLIVNLIGTEFDFDLDNKILFLEEVGEEPYRIDKMLTHLINSKKLEKCNGIILGKFSDCEVKKDNPSFRQSLNLREVLIDRLSSLGIPVIYGLSFGHIKNKFTLPLGVTAMFDVDKEKFALIESAVI
jgi:muramoyltetrapeptide carboxypeptidase